MKYSFYIRFCTVIVMSCVVSFVCAEQMPADYYASIEGKKDAALKSQLSSILNADSVKTIGWGSGKTHTWGAFYVTDRNEDDNSVIDMYSSVKRYFTEQGESVQGLDIEHSVPNSWWGGYEGNRVAYRDLHLLVPADYSANRSKSNIPPGYVQAPATFDNLVMKNGIPMNMGTFSYPEGLSKVFEPIDEYKGDFARMYFYTVTRYEETPWIVEKNTVESCYAMQNDNYLEFQPWLQQLLLEWHRLDPVSEKEVIRQDYVFEWQRNRNPFIDYPELVEYIWGNKQGTIVVLKNLRSTQLPFAEALEATDISEKGFTARWIMPKEAQHAELNVYHKDFVRIDSALLVNLPKSSVKYINANGLVDTCGSATSNLTGGVCVRLGTRYDNLHTFGHVYITGMVIDSGARLTIAIAPFDIEHDTVKIDAQPSLAVRFNNVPMDTTWFYTSDTIWKTYQLPNAIDTLDTIWIDQTTPKKPVLVRSIFVKQEQFALRNISEHGFPKTVNAVNSFVVNVTMDKTMYYTVCPDGQRTSNIIEVKFTQPMDIEQTKNNNTLGVKRLVNGHIMIEHQGQLYTILGQKQQ